MTCDASQNRQTDIRFKYNTKTDLHLNPFSIHMSSNDMFNAAMYAAPTVLCNACGGTRYCRNFFCTSFIIVRNSTGSSFASEVQARTMR